MENMPEGSCEASLRFFLRKNIRGIHKISAKHNANDDS